MSYADQLFIQNCKDILTNGVWDTDHEVRPVWEDGTPAREFDTFPNEKQRISRMNAYIFLSNLLFLYIGFLAFCAIMVLR